MNHYILFKRGTSIPIEIDDKELQLLQSVKLLTDEQKDYVMGATKNCNF